MPLQNRVTPFGDIVAVPVRGTMMGNRGVLHDDERRIVRPWQVRRWIACRLEFRGRRRAVMHPHSYTELFFLDEAVAFAAGHRPCAECRRADYNRFRELWLQCHGGTGKADDIDAVMHADRLMNRRTKRTYRDDAARLPDGTLVTTDGAAWLLHGDALHRWGDGGYTERRPSPKRGTVEVLTARCVVEVMRAGYAPLVHSSAGER